MIGSSAKLLLAGFLVLCAAVVVSSEVCPHDYVILQVADGENTPSRKQRQRVLLEDEEIPPIEVMEQGGDYVDIVVHNTTAYGFSPDHMFVQFEHGQFFSDKCLLEEGLGAGAATDVLRASCLAGDYAIVWVFARSVTTAGHGSSSIPQCCDDPYSEDIPADASIVKFAFEVSCVPTCDDPIDNTTDDPTSSPTTPQTEPRLPRRSLQQEIIQDMMPDSSSVCEYSATSSTFEFESSQEESQWYEPFVPFEEGLFLAKMQHIDDNFNRSWTIRFGQAGNIYSMVGPMGETVPPQAHNNAPWVDEVWQAVQPLGNGGDNDNDPNTDVYFIHEAGTYTRDGDLSQKPFYSPTIGSYCDDEKGECGFASWGQHAHVPTPWKSGLLYLNRYVNCGNGVFEYTTLRHNIVGNSDTFGYMNVPWGGTRASVLGDIVLTKKSTEELEVVYPLNGWGSGTARALKDTMGFTVFAEDLPKASNPLHDTPYTLPTDLDLTIKLECYCEGQCRLSSHRYVCPLVNQPVDHGWVPNRGAPGLKVRLEGVDTGKSIIAGVRHWAGNDKLYFYQSDLLTLSKIKAALTPGTKVNVYHYYPADLGKPEEDNLALGHVHGGTDGAGAYPRVRYGAAGRDYNVYTINDIPKIVPGSSYYYRQYFMMDSYTEMKGKGMLFAPEAIKATKPVGSIPGRTVTLYKSSENTFGYAVAEDSCRSAGAELVCQGSTTPQSNMKPLFEIYCGETYAVTDNLYHFTPAGPPYRSYVCDGMPGTRPVWTLLGYFPIDDCIEIESSYEFDPEYC